MQWMLANILQKGYRPWKGVWDTYQLGKVERPLLLVVVFAVTNPFFGLSDIGYPLARINVGGGMTSELTPSVGAG